MTETKDRHFWSVLAVLYVLLHLVACSPRDGLTADQRKRLAVIIDYRGYDKGSAMKEAISELQKSKAGIEWQLRDLELNIEIIQATITNRAITDAVKVDANQIMASYGFKLDSDHKKTALPKVSAPFFELYRDVKILTDEEAKGIWDAYTSRTEIASFMFKDEPVQSPPSK